MKYSKSHINLGGINMMFFLNEQQHFRKKTKDNNIKQIHKKSALIIKSAYLGLIIGFGACSSAFALELIDLGANVKPLDINNNGTVVGAKNTNQYPNVAFRWTASSGIEILDGIAANAINDNEVVAGNAQAGAFFYDGGVLTNLGAQYTAQGINSLGQLAGSQEKINPFRRTNGKNPAIYHPDTQSWSFLDVARFGSRGRRKGVYADLYNLMDINDSGYAVGTKRRYGLSGSFGFAITPGSQTVAFVPQASNALAINDLNHIVGTTRFMRPGGTRNPSEYIYPHAYFYDLDTDNFIDLGTLPPTVGSASAASSWAYDINESDQVVGFSQVVVTNSSANAPQSIHAFIWENGQMTDLNDLIQPSAWLLTKALAINDNGDIVGIGLKNGVEHGFVLNVANTNPPVPVNQIPVAKASADVTSGSTPLKVNFDGSGSFDSDGSIVDFFWDFGDGNSSNMANPSHTFASVGDYIVTLTVTDDKGETNSASVTISVKDISTGCSVNCVLVDKISLNYRAKSKKIIGRVFLVDENNRSTIKKGAVVNVTWLLPDGSTIKQKRKIKKQSWAAYFKLKKVKASGVYKLTVDSVTDNNRVFDPDNSNTLFKTISISR